MPREMRTRFPYVRSNFATPTLFRLRTAAARWRLAGYWRQLPEMTLLPRTYPLIAYLTRLLLLGILAVGFCASDLVPRAKSQPMTTGVSIVGTVEVGDASVAADRVRDAGGSFLTTWVRWNDVAPKTKPADWDPSNPFDPHYDWSRIDPWVVETNRAGLKPLLQIYGAPRWANRCKPSAALFVESAAPCNPKLDEMSQFFKAAATRYSGRFQGLPRVRYWQVQNEPNLYVFFNPQLDSRGRYRSPDLYRALLTRMYATLKSVDPTNVVLAAGLAPNNPGKAVPPMNFARELLCLNARNRPFRSGRCRGGVPLDVFDMHPYTSGGPTRKAPRGRGGIQFGNLKQLAAIVRAADRAGHIKGMKRWTPLWITEMSWDSRPPDPGGVPMNLLTRWTAEAVYRSWQAGFEAFFWYSLRDRDRGDLPWSESDQSGLYFRQTSIVNDVAKPSLRAFRFPFVSFADGKRGFRFWGRTPAGIPGKVVIQLNTRGSFFRVATKRANGSGLFAGYVRSKAGKRKRGMVRAVFGSQPSVPFSLRPVRDRSFRPFG